MKYLVATIALLFTVSASYAAPHINSTKNKSAPKHSIVKKHKKLEVVHGKV
jgi:hypothetical protein